MTTNIENGIDSLIEYRHDLDRIKELEANIKSAKNTLRTCTDREDKRDLLENIHNSHIELEDIKARQDERKNAEYCKEHPSILLMEIEDLGKRCAMCDMEKEDEELAHNMGIESNTSEDEKKEAVKSYALA